MVHVMLFAAGGRAQNPEWLPELAGFGASRYLPPSDDNLDECPST
jgi:hypothetical protein